MQKLNLIEKILQQKVKKFTNINTGINPAYKVVLENDTKVFIKISPNSINEAKQLRFLSKIINIPTIIFVSNELLILQYLEQQFNQKSSIKLANQLIKLHHITSDKFGFKFDNNIGPTNQINTLNHNWADFYWKNRLLFQINLAFDKQLLNNNDYQTLLSLEPINYQLLAIDIVPTLLHGDLWSGNIISTKNNIYFIDSACYFGHYEADLSLGFMFGGFNDGFYQKYFALMPQQQGFAKRKYLYMLYHYLNHLNIFGKNYYANVLNCCKQIF